MSGSRDETLVDGDQPTPAPGRTWVGRYLLLELLGRGGMGVVHKAYDPALQRHVAVKLLAGGGARPERLHREGQVIAKLSHPNVVSVFDLGHDRDQLYIAMEYVPGQTLAAWLEQRRTVADALPVMIQAARGLAAGHARGIVHRDVKPSNILLGDDGVVRVVDFGIARATGVDDTDVPDGVSSDSIAGALTAAGTLLGTPRYMAPEQYLGGAVGPATDQYAFCVVLYEALAGRSPFAAMTHDELKALGRARDVLPWPDDARVPAWLARVVARGLAADPARRFPSMDEVVAELSADRTRTRRRVLAATAFGGVTAAAITAVVVMREPPVDPCAGAARAAAAVRFDDAVRVGPGFASAVDDRLVAWRAMRVDACEAVHVRRVESAQAFDARMICLDRRLAELGALVRTAAAPGAVEDDAFAVDAMRGLPGLAACADVETLSQVPPLPDDPTARARVDGVFARLDDGFALKHLDRVEEALVIAEPALADARATAHPPLIADALSLASGVYRRLGRTDDAVRTLWEMYRVAAGMRDDFAMADALIALLYVIGTPDDPRFAQAVALVPVVEGLALRTGDDELIGKMWLNTGLVLDQAGTDEVDAERRYREALAVKARLFGADSLEVAYVENNLGLIASERGRFEDAVVHLDTSLRIKRAELGDGHHSVISGLYNLGSLLESAGRSAEALARYDEGLVAAGSAASSDPSLVARLHLARADTLVTLDRMDDALAAARAAERLLRERLPDDQVLAAMARFGVGHVLHARGELAAAIAEYRTALALTEAALGADSAHVYNPVYQLGKALCASGRRDEGARFAERAVKVAPLHGVTAEANAERELARCRGDAP